MSEDGNPTRSDVPMHRGGDWLAVVSGRTVALLGPAVDTGTAEQVWRAMRRGDGSVAVLERLVDAFGLNLKRLPAFAVASYDEDGAAVRVILRGPVSASVTTESDGTRHPLGRDGSSPWVDRAFADPALVEFTVDEGPTPCLPLGDGVARAGALRWSPAGTESAAPADAEHAGDGAEAAARSGAPGRTSPRGDGYRGPDTLPVSILDTGDAHAEPTVAAESPSAPPDAVEADRRPSPPPPPPPAVPTLIAPDGVRYALDRPVVLGRKPRTDDADGETARLVAIRNPTRIVSRTHVRVRLDGERIVATDLGSGNGTSLLRAGAAPERLIPGTEVAVTGDDRLDLGDGVLLAFETL